VFMIVLAVLIDHKYQDSTVDILTLASVLYEHVHACLCKPNLNVKYKSKFCQGPQTSSPSISVLSNIKEMACMTAEQAVEMNCFVQFQFCKTYK
jgi:hypothetical protein